MNIVIEVFFIDVVFQNVVVCKSFPRNTKGVSDPISLREHLPSSREHLLALCEITKFRKICDERKFQHLQYVAMMYSQTCIKRTLSGKSLLSV